MICRQNRDETAVKVKVVRCHRLSGLAWVVQGPGDTVNHQLWDAHLVTEADTLFIDADGPVQKFRESFYIRWERGMGLADGKAVFYDFGQLLLIVGPDLRQGLFKNAGGPAALLDDRPVPSLIQAPVDAVKSRLPDHPEGVCRPPVRKQPPGLDADAHMGSSF